MNLILTDVRSAMLTEHVSALMYIKLHGPPVAHWKVVSYVKSWLTKHRSSSDARTRVAADTSELAMEHPDPLWDIL